MAPAVDRSWRFDLYLCAATKGSLVPAASGVSTRHPSIDAGALANAVYDRIRVVAAEKGRSPNVFYAPRCVQERRDECVDASLQTRGGGVALFMITRLFLSDQASIAQMLRFLSLQEKASDEAKFTLRFVCVGISEEEFLQHPAIQPHAHRLQEYVRHSVPLGSIEEVTHAIVELVWEAWLSRLSPNVLGATVKDSLQDLLYQVFPENGTSLAKLVFGIEDRKVTTLAAVFAAALSMYKLGGGYNGAALLDKLAAVGSGLLDDEKRAAIAAYNRKWAQAEAWGWGSDMRDELNSITASTPGLPGSPVSSGQDATQPPGFVRRNPSVILLDYDSLDTAEGQLKSLLLEIDSPRKLVAAVGAFPGLAASPGGAAPPGVAAVHGMGGVGKTCALRGLGWLPDVWKRFPGGIFFLELGQDASVDDVLKTLAKIMRARDNNMLAEDISRCMTVREAVDIVVTALANVCCLFLVDDVWQTSSCDGGHLKYLQHLVETCEMSRIVFSTRDSKIAKYADGRIASFNTRDEPTSRKILLRYAGFTKEEADSMPADATASLLYALDKCDGLPIALASTGRLVESESKRLGKDTPKFEAWNVYKKNAPPYHTLCEHAQHPGFSAALLQCIDEVDRRLRGDDQEYKHSAAEMYRGLCILQKKSWAPFTMLGALWNSDTEWSGVARVVDQFEGLNMLEIVVRKVGKSFARGFKIHDLAHDFCIQQACQHDGSVRKWHACVLDGYLPRLHRA